MAWEEIMRRVLPPVGGVSPHVTDAGAFGAGVEQGRHPPSSIPHGGVDFDYVGGRTIRLNRSNPVLHSPVAGVVVNAGEGNVGRIAIRDANGFTHEILHTHTQRVKKGDLVGVGTPIGTMGNRGVKRANVEDGDYHAHYQLKDRSGNVIDPTEFWNNLDLGKDDPGQPAFLDQSKRAAEIQSGMDEKSSRNGGVHPDRLGRAFFNPFDQAPVAGFVPLPSTSASDAPASFAGRFGSWAAQRGLSKVGAPAPQPAPKEGRRTELPEDVIPTSVTATDDDNAPVRILGRRVVNLSTAPAPNDAPPFVPNGVVSSVADGPASSRPLLGISSGKPMPEWPVRPSIFQTKDQASPDDDDLYQRWIRWLDF